MLTSNRISLFLIGCIGARILLTYIVKIHNTKYKNILAAILFIQALGLSIIYIKKYRKTGLEVFGNKIWWNFARPFHALMYYLTSYLVYVKNKNAYIVIGLDTLVGVILYLTHYKLI